jgi:endonuclease III
VNDIMKEMAMNAIAEITEEVELLGYLPLEHARSLISTIGLAVTRANILSKQLSYAVENNGEFLPEDKIITHH